MGERPGQSIGYADQKVSAMEILFRLTRIQFVPLIILPVLVVASHAYHVFGRINLGLLPLVLVGTVT